MDTSLLERVRQIIADSGLKQNEIAERIGIDETKLSKSLSGKRKFSSLELALIAQIGDRTVDWLLTGVPPRNFQVAARSAAAELEIDENVTTDLLSELAERYDALRDLGFAPVAPVLPSKPVHARYVDEARDLARIALSGSPEVQLRDLDTSELINKIEEKFGITVVAGPLPDDLDGLAHQDAEFRVIALGTTGNAARQRFTLAHELGHILSRDAEERFLAERMWSPPTGNDRNQESRADAFAAAFLLPERELRESLDGRDPRAGFDELVWQFRVSPASMAWRMLNLKLIDEPTCRELRAEGTKAVARRLDRIPEYLARIDASSRPREPWLLITAYLDAYRAGNVTLRPIASMLRWTLEHAEAFFGDDPDDDTDHDETYES